MGVTANDSIILTLNTYNMSTSNEDKRDYLSRSALADKLGVPLKELTQVMIEAGWISQQGKDWLLTSKGEFEGGIYKHSKKYGQYIIWPETIFSHAVITELGEKHISATVIAKHYGLSARMVNRLLAEMGFIHAFAKGWQLTPLGLSNGGLQQQDKDSGVPYTMWPKSFLDHVMIRQHFNCYQGVSEALECVTIADQPHYLALDGHYFPSIELLKVANWLYIVGISYAYRRQLMVADDEYLLSDFYLPSMALHIHYNSHQVSPEGLSKQLARQQQVKDYQIYSVELLHTDIDNIDSVLSKALLTRGITVV